MLAGVSSAGEPNAQRVNHFVGAAGESIPIQVPPFHGIEPRLSLSYSSEARNGFAGMGWNLAGFSVIERANSSLGFPVLNDTDTYLLDGQGLLACPDGSTYPSCAAGGTHYTHQESYLKIKRVNEDLWQVFGKDGTRTDFETIQTAPKYGGGTHAVKLGQKRVVDTHANTVLYNWTEEVGGVHGAIYPDTVTYSGYTIQFIRETRPDGPLTRSSWSDISRQDARLKTIRIHDAAKNIRAYRLEYSVSTTTAKSLLTSVQMYGKDVILDSNGSVSSGPSLPAQSFTYSGDAAAASFTGDVQMSNAGPPAATGTENVVWSYRTNTTPSGDGSTLTADALPDGWDKVGYSTRALANGLGYMEFTYSGGASFAAYLGAWGAYFGAPGSMTVVGPGAGSNGPFTVAVGSVVRVEVVAGGVSVRVAGATVLTVSGTPAYPMVAYGSLYRGGDSISAARLSGNLVNYFGADCAGSPRFSGDFNGDGREDSVCKTSLNNMAVTLATASGFLNPTLWANWTSNIAGVGDFNSDGKDDIVFFDSFWGVAYVGLSDGMDFGAITSWGAVAGNSPSPPYAMQACRFDGATIGKVADFTGDGRADLFCYVPTSPDRQFVAISQNTNFDSYVFGEGGDCASYLKSGADVNADGREDLFCMVPNGDLRSYRSGSGFYGADTLASFCSVSEYSFGDWNGDGTTDAACANNGRAALRSGAGFVELAATTTYCVSGQRLAADLDGDGAAEWICNNPGSPADDILVRKWNGLAFGTSQILRGSFCPGTVAAADFNGDGKTDLLCESSGSVIYAGTKNVKADLLVSSSNGIGGVTTLSWSTTTAAAMNLTGGPSMNGLPAKYLIIEQSSTDGRMPTPVATSFAYYDGAQSPVDRKFYGFRRIKETQPALPGETSPPYINRVYRIDAAAAGRLDSVSHWDGDGKLLTRTSYEYLVSEVTGAGARRTAEVSAIWNYQLTGLTADCAWPAPWCGKRTKTEFTYDNHGNVKVVTNHGDFDAQGDETTTGNTYAHHNGPAPEYVVDRLGYTETFAGIGLGGALLSRRVNAYDGASWWDTAPSRGDLTSSWSWLVNATESRYTGASTWAYDGHGNVVLAVDPTGRSTTTVWDATHRFPTESFPTTIPELVVKTTWDIDCGVPKDVKDQNDVMTVFGMDDPFCRPTTTTVDGTLVEARSYPDIGVVQSQKVRVEMTGAAGSAVEAVSYFDGWGRTYKTVRSGPNPIVSETRWNERGAVKEQSAPYYLGDPVKWTTFEYDKFGRLKKTTLPGGAARWVQYPGMTADNLYFQRTDVNEAYQETTSKFDGRGLLRMTSRLNLNTTRNYDRLGRMTSLVDPGGNTWTYTFDTLGRNVAKADPDAGVWLYRYDDAGRLQNYQDAKGQTISFVYDQAGRQEKKRIRLGNLSSPVHESVETAYGSTREDADNGRVTSIRRISGTAGAELNGRLEFEYDALGRVIKQTRILDGANYVVERNYDAQGFLRGMKYPDGDIIGQFGGSGAALGYDEAGRLTSIPGILTSVTYNAMGAPLVQTNANDTVTTRTYDPNRHWLTDIDTTAPLNVVLQNLHYSLNDLGMANSVSSDVTNEAWTYQYDSLNRLTSTSNHSPYGQSWTYDNLGRMTYNSRVGTYAYPTPGPTAVRPHGPTNIAGSQLVYDPNGNMTTANGRTMTWNAENMITQVASNGKTTTFTYGPDGERIKKHQAMSPLLKYPFGDDYELRGPDGAEQVTKYFNAGFGPIAKKVGGTLYWLHTDRLGSVNAVTDDEGVQELRRSYRSYGELLGQTGTHDESLGYIGQRTDDETANGTTDDKGLTYLHARYYDSALGIFLSPDPAEADSNTYRYSSNDPANIKDPSGLCGETYTGRSTSIYGEVTEHPVTRGVDCGLRDFGTFWWYFAHSTPDPEPREPRRPRNPCAISESHPDCKKSDPPDEPECDPADPNGGCYVPPERPGCGQGFASAGESCLDPKEFDCADAMLGLPCPVTVSLQAGGEGGFAGFIFGLGGYSGGCWTPSTGGIGGVFTNRATVNPALYGSIGASVTVSRGRTAGRSHGVNVALVFVTVTATSSSVSLSYGPTWPPVWIWGSADKTTLIGSCN